MLASRSQNTKPSHRQFHLPNDAELSRNARRLMIAALRLASLVIVFGRKSRFGGLSVGGMLAVGAWTFSGLLLNSAFAASTCQTGTTTQSTVSGEATCSLGNYNPVPNDTKIGEARVGAGDNVTLTSPNAKNIQTGNVGYQFQPLSSKVSSTGMQLKLATGDENNGVTIKDPITGANQVIKTYGTSNIKTTVWGDDSIQAPQAVNDTQYVDMRLGTATTGGTLHINIGDGSKKPLDNVNSMSGLAVKQSTLAEAATGGTVFWDSKNLVTTNVFSLSSGTAPISVSANIVTFVGQFTGPGGKDCQ